MTLADTVEYLGVLLVYALIFFRGSREGMIRRYSWFYVYIGVVALTTLPMPLMYWYILHSSLYGQIYFAELLVQSFLRVWILLTLYRLLLDGLPAKRARIRSDVLLGVLLVAPFWVLLIVGLDDYFYYRTYLVYTFELVLCLILYKAAIRNRALRLGRNWGGILLGFSLQAVSFSIPFSRLATDMTTYEVFAPALKIGYIVSLTVLLCAMWRYGPLRRLDDDDRRLADRIGMGWVEAVRSWRRMGRSE